jgi:hypothetical protein
MNKCWIKLNQQHTHIKNERRKTRKSIKTNEVKSKVKRYKQNKGKTKR